MSEMPRCITGKIRGAVGTLNRVARKGAVAYATAPYKMTLRGGDCKKRGPLAAFLRAVPGGDAPPEVLSESPHSGSHLSGPGHSGLPRLRQLRLRLRRRVAFEDRKQQMIAPLPVDAEIRARVAFLLEADAQQQAL